MNFKSTEQILYEHFLRLEKNIREILNDIRKPVKLNIRKHVKLNISEYDNISIKAEILNTEIDIEDFSLNSLNPKQNRKLNVCYYIFIGLLYMLTAYLFAENIKYNHTNLEYDYIELNDIYSKTHDDLHNLTVNNNILSGNYDILQNQFNRATYAIQDMVLNYNCLDSMYNTSETNLQHTNIDLYNVNIELHNINIQNDNNWDKLQLSYFLNVLQFLQYIASSCY